ncbi:MAG TPA: POTRA domain-containing protein [Candidatus Acidoferrum sp.]|nr:POTRA domain-containing protein [Candidatus Acidoferrum sp.]
MKIGCAPLVVSFLGLLAATISTASPQASESFASEDTSPSSGLLSHAIISEIKFVGLRRIAHATAMSRLSIHAGEEFNDVHITADVHVLSQAGWFEDVFVRAIPLIPEFESSHSPQTVALQFHVQEYPYLAAVSFTGSKLLSQQQIAKLLADNKLSPQVGAPSDPVRLHRAALAIRSELAAAGHPEGQVLIRQAKLPGQKTKVEFQIRDGPRLPVSEVNFSGAPGVPEKILRKQMRQISPDAWFAGLRNKDIYTPEKDGEDRLNLLTYLHNHGFPQARAGASHVTVVNAFSDPSSPWRLRPVQPGLSVTLPVDAGNFYAFGRPDISAPLQQRLNAIKKANLPSLELKPGRPYSQHAVESLRRDLEIRLRQNGHHRKGITDYRLRATSTFNYSAHIATVNFDLDPTPPYTVRRLDFRGNQRFPDRYLRRRIPLGEGQPLDEYAIEAGLARLARTGYFQPFKKEDIEINTHPADNTADVVIHLREKGKQRISFSGGRQQFGSTVGIAYTVFNLLGLDEFLSTQFDGGPESLQLAIGFAKEGFLGSRGTLALSAFDTFLRPRLTPGVQGPFQRSQSQGVNVGWNYAASNVDAIGVNFGLSRSVTDYSINQPSAAANPQPIELQSKTSSRSLGFGWTRDTGAQKFQLDGSVSGGWLGGSENLLKAKTEYSQIFPDEIFNHRNAWAFRTTASVAGSYRGDMPLYARFFSGDDFVRGLRPGELGPYQALTSNSPLGATTYSAVPTGANLLAASNLEYRVPLTHTIEAATFLDAGSGFLLPNWLGPTRPALIQFTNGLIHSTTGLELRWTLPIVGAPVRINYLFNLLRLNRVLFFSDSSTTRLHDPLGALGWGLGPLF